MTLLDRVLTTVRKFDMIPPRARVLAAVSGGADSVALALVLARLAPDLGFTLTGIAHLNHGLRGDEADRDEAFAAGLADRLGVRFVARREDIAAHANDAGESIETAARRVRYDFLHAAASEIDAGLIATGHTADDQAETVIMRLMRGAGLHGLSGVRPRNGDVIRPLIEARRSAIESFLRDAGETWRDDASNADIEIARNRVRHQVMPVLKAIGGEGVVDALARSASLIQDDADELDARAIEMSRSIVLPSGVQGSPRRDDRSIDAAALAALSPAMARRMLRAAIAPVTGGRFLSLEHVEAVRSLIKGKPRAAVQLPGAVVRLEGGILRIVPAGHAAPDDGFATSLPVPGIAEVPGAGLVMSAELGSLSSSELSALRARADMVAVQGLEPAALTIRSRRPGDALRPLGGPGRRKLQDVFTDRKVARQDRDRVPLVVDDLGRIVWVVGHTIAEEFRVTSPGERVLLLKVTQK